MENSHIIIFTILALAVGFSVAVTALVVFLVIWSKRGSLRRDSGVPTGFGMDTAAQSNPGTLDSGQTHHHHSHGDGHHHHHHSTPDAGSHHSHGGFDSGGSHHSGGFDGGGSGGGHH